MHFPATFSNTLKLLVSPDGLRLFLPLLAAYLIATFVFRISPSTNGRFKGMKFLAPMITAAVLSYIAVGVWWAWWIPLITAIAYATVDGVKATLPKESGNKQWVFWVVRAASLLVIAVIATFSTNKLLENSWWNDWPGQEQILKIWTLLSGLVLSIWVGSVVIGYWITPWLNQIEENSENSKNNIRPLKRGLENGGRTIGMWERGMITALVLLGELGAVGFLVAAKSVFRFGELQDRSNRMEAEYIIIGTLMSFLWAMIFGWATHQGISAITEYFKLQCEVTPF